MKTKLDHFISPSLFRTSVYALLGIILWSVTFIGSNLSWGSAFNEILLLPVNGTDIRNNIISLILTLINSILISQLVVRFNLANIRTLLPFFIFFFLIISWEPCHAIYQSHIALTLFILALFQLFDIHHDPRPVEKIFLGTLLLGTAGLFLNELIFIVPVCWLGFVIFQCFSLRTFLSSLLGLICPWIIYSAVYYFIFPDISFQDIYHYNPEWGFSLTDLSIGSIIYIAALSIILIISVIKTYIEFHTNTNTVRKTFNFIVVLLLFFILVSSLQSQITSSFTPFIALCYTLLVIQSFLQKQGRYSTIIFIAFCILNLLYIIYNLIV